MKAIRVHEYGGPAVMNVEDVPDPRPGPGEVVVRVRAAGVNPVDAYIHTRHLRAQAGAALHTGDRTAQARLRRSAPTSRSSGPVIASISPASARRSPAPARMPSWRCASRRSCTGFPARVSFGQGAASA